MGSDTPINDEATLHELSEGVHSNGNGRKRRLSESSEDENAAKKRSKPSDSTGKEHSMNQVRLLREPDLPAFNLINAVRSSPDSTSHQGGEASADTNSIEWQTINRRAKTATKKIPRKDSSNYPKLEFSKSSRLQAQIKISDIQGLVLYILADGTAPQFISVQHRSSIRKVVVLMVPGLETSMFDAMKVGGGAESRDTQDDRGRDSKYTSPDEYYPTILSADALSEPLRPLAEVFPYVWPVKTPGDDRFGKMHSPLHAMLTAPLPKEKEDKKNNNQRNGARPAKTPSGWKGARTRITEFIHTPEELLENDYVVHPVSYSRETDKQAWEAHRQSSGTSCKSGWVDTHVDSLNDGNAPEKDIESGSLTAGREVLALDCEMCMTGQKESGENEFSLTRISLVGWDGSVILDELVKPAKPITNYVTQ